jgi:hypothetical protein
MIAGNIDDRCPASGSGKLYRELMNNSSILTVYGFLRTLKYSRISDGLNSQIIGNQIFGFLQNSHYAIFFYNIVSPLSESFFFL